MCFWRQNLKRFLNDTKKYWNYMIYAAKSQLKAEVANSHLNWIWWILEPFCSMLIYVFVFGFLFKNKQEYFSVFIFIALALWDNFNRCVRAAVTIVRQNKAIISRVYMPKHALIISTMMVNLFKMGIYLLIVLVMLLYYRVTIDYHILFIIPVILIAEIFTFGCCCILAHLGVFIDDMSNMINILLRFVYFLTGVFYNIEVNIPKPYSTILLRCNPLAMFINDMRSCLMYQKSPDWMMELIWLCIAIVISIIGVATVYRYENAYVKVI